MHVRAYIRAALAAAFGLCLTALAHAQVAQFRAIVVASCGSVTLPLNEPATPYMDRNGIFCTTAGAGGGGGGSTGSVTAPGTSGTAAQAIQGINGGVPVPVTGSFSAAAAPGSQEQDVRASTTLNAATANAAVTIPINGQGTVGFTFTGLTASGATLAYEQSNDTGTTWTGINEVNAGTGVPSSTRTTDGQTRVSVSGRTNLRVRVSVAGTGTITVAYNISVREGLMTLASPLPPGTNPVGFAGSGQYNSTLPTLASGAYAYLQTDQSARLLLAPTSSVLADLRVAGAPVGSGNPVPVSGTVTANLGTLNGAALDTSVQSVRTTLGSPFQAGGSIGNTSFGISGQLPGYATTPTFNIGTLGGAATAAGQSAQQGAVAPGTAATTSVLSGLIYNATPPAPTNGQQLAAQSDAAGNLKINNATLSPNAASASNQATEIAALQAIQQRAAVFSEVTAASVAASGNSTGTSRDVGAAPLYTKFNAVVSSTQNGTLTLQGSNDNFTTTVGVASVATTANVPAYLTAPVLFRYSRYVFVNGNTTTAATVTVNTSYTAN